MADFAIVWCFKRTGLAYPAFEALKDISLFKQARVAHNTVVWNEEVDMASENLYLESTPVWWVNIQAARTCWDPGFLRSPHSRGIRPR